MANASASIPKPQGGINEAELLDFAAALAITLPKNENIAKSTIFLASTGEPVEGYVGSPLVRHCKEWTTLKKNADIISKLQGLMYLKVIVCVAVQVEDDQNWNEYQNSSEYLYAFDETKINIYKCPSRGQNYVDKQRWDKQYEEEEITTELTKNNRVNKGGVMSESHGAPIQITFSIGGKTMAAKTEKIIKVTEKARDARLTQSEIEKRRQQNKERQQKLNESMKKKGKTEWKWKQNKRDSLKKVVTKPAAVEKKQPVITVDKVDDDAKQQESPLKVRKRLVSYDDSYPIGSDDIKYYEQGQICSVFNGKQWVDGEVLEVIKFVKTIKIKYDGNKVKSFRLPNLKMVRLKNY